jgi:hypothetical protein
MASFHGVLFNDGDHDPIPGYVIVACDVGVIAGAIQVVHLYLLPD